MKRCLLDSSFVTDYLNEIASRQAGPAHAWFQRNTGADLWVSPVTYAEVMEGANGAEAVRQALRAFRWQTIGHQQAERVALCQSRADQRMGENDAWQATVAACMDAVLVGHDPAFTRLGTRYDDHRKS
jgi:predicted nucleic acid-binding protein